MFLSAGVIFFMYQFQNTSKHIRCSAHQYSGLPNITTTANGVAWMKNISVNTEHDDLAKVLLNNGNSLGEPPKPSKHSVDDRESSSNMKVMAGKSCQPHTHVFFLKTHKTGSSTIMNILFRFGESHNLTFALPNYFAQFYYPYYFSADFVEGFRAKIHHHYDIMCHHMRFQITEVERVMPNDTFYFTVLRNPVSLMESSFSYYKDIDIFIKARSLEEYLRNTDKYYNKSSVFSYYGKNLMTFDLGFHHNGRETPKHCQLIQEAVERMFNLVLITEYFDESLVLLKDALCWSFDDVLSFPLNSRNNTSRKVLSIETQEKIKTWNQFDWQLYVYFNSSFWKRVDKFGRERMQLEVQELQRRRAKQSEICLQGLVDPQKIKDESIKPFQAGLARILGYNLKPGLGNAEKLLCQRLVTPELQYTTNLRNKQKQS
ncbi:galactose-3-O-sulfotransferase 2-like [Mixophyes fleayi]|uniref:galactose-3-O-sulfotransferase 2-like n=1 Tax=Mixophyes fleayi TaxID=3061075 RepID=UPI003F4DC838